jgi:hypothetical protein
MYAIEKRQQKKPHPLTGTKLVRGTTLIADSIKGICLSKRLNAAYGSVCCTQDPAFHHSSSEIFLSHEYFSLWMGYDVLLPFFDLSQFIYPNYKKE